MSRRCWFGWAGLALGALGLLVGLARAATDGADERRLEELHAYARRADEHAPRTPATDELWERLADLDRRLRECLPEDMKSGVAGTSPWLPAELEEQRARVAQAEPCLAAWAELCADPALQRCLERGERIPEDTPRFMSLRSWGHLLAWRAYFQTQDPVDRALAAETLASVFDLAAAFGDRTLIAEMIGVALEQRALLEAWTFVEESWLDAGALRAALEPRLRRGASEQRDEELVLHEVRRSLELVERAVPGLLCRSSECACRELGSFLEHFASVERALALARLPAAELHRIRLEQSDGSFVSHCYTAFSTLDRHRSIISLFRVALAVGEHRERTGALPEALSELGPAFEGDVPTDPLTGAPFPWTIAADRGRLGPTACPQHGSERECAWDAALEGLLAFEL